MKCPINAQWSATLVAGTGVLLVFVGSLLIALWPQYYQSILNSELHLSETSTSYRMWRDTPVPLYIQFYFFNWTNPGDLEKKNIKPILKEIGPYRFNEFHEKVDIEFHEENNTVSFRQVRRWQFDPDHSRGNLDDLITTLNIPPLTAAFVARNWNILMQTPLSLAITQLETRHVTKTVREFLFDGYEDPLVSLAGKLPALAQVNIPFNRFGWFYERNNSDVYDGHFNMDTGAADISQVGILRYWNYAKNTKYFSSYCGNVNGSAGELWPPGQTKTNISMFSPDLCRSLTFHYSQDAKIHDIIGYRFTGGADIVDNGTLDASNKCFCGGECLPSGVVNASSCRYGAPAFVSYPHFYMADPYYKRLVEGMKPRKEKHRFYVTLEPTTGIPLDVAARFQINILLQPNPYIKMYRHVPRIFFPIIWFEQRATMTPELATELRGLLLLTDIVMGLGICILVIGVILLVTVALFMLHCKMTKSKETSQKRPIDTPVEAFSTKSPPMAATEMHNYELKDVKSEIKPEIQSTGA